MRFGYPLAFLLFSQVSTNLAADLSVPSGWREFTNNRPRSERVTIAQNALNTIVSQLNSSIGEFNGIGFWQSGNVYSVMALQDIATATTTNQNVVVNNLKRVFALYNGFDKFGWWAHSAWYAFKAYGDQQLLNDAKSTWNSVSRFQITAAQVASGSNPLKSFPLAQTCFGVSMVGGVFWRPTSDDTSINSVTTGLFMTLSAYLAENTGETKYRDAALASAKWIQSLNINADGVVLDTVDGKTCARSPPTWLFTYNTGKYIEGLSVLADVTGDSQWRTLMVNMLAVAVKYPQWEGSNGVITEGSNTSANDDGVGFKAIYIRGLMEAFKRNAQNTDLRILIHSYVDVQYNALLELARNGDSYSANWLGPPMAYTSWGQLAALDVLTAAISAND